MSMYGQGNFDPQFRPGLPTRPPAPPLRQTLLPPPIHQGSPQPQLPPQQTPPPPPYPQLSVQPPAPAPANMGQTYFHLPPLYNPPGPSYSHMVPQPMPPPPRVFPMPRPPPHGQVMYRAPQPPPLGIQHLPAPPPPHPSGFVSVTPAPFASNEALPPSLPPPPLPPPPPPSSPPPLPPSPPPPVCLTLGHEGPSTDKAESHTKSEGDDHPPSLQVPNGSAVGKAEKDVHVENGETFDVRKALLMDEGPPVAEKKVSVVKEDTLGGLPLSPPKPHDEEVVKNIEALCQLIQKYGPTFEEEARVREAGNPCFSFLFGGQPESASAIGHAYFQWMKTKCRLESKHHKDSEYILQSAKLEDEGTAYSPADSDMDMDDDASHPDEGKGLDDLNRNSEDSDVHVVKELLPATQDTARQLEPESYSSFVSCSGSLKLEHNKDEYASSLMEDVRPTLTSSACDEGAKDSNVQASIKSSSEDISLDKGLPSAASCKSEELPRVFVKDGSPFRLIQGYASDDSCEDDKGEEMINVTPIRASTTAAMGFSGMNRNEGFDLYSSCSLKKASDIEISCETKTGLSKPSPAIMTKAETSSSWPWNSASITATSPCPHNAKEEGAEFGSHQQGDNKCDHHIAPAESSQHSDSFKCDSIYVNQQIGKLHQEEDAKEDSPSLAVDEFGRLLRKAASDSDSDGVDYRERSMKRGRSRSHSLSPQRNRRRRMSRSPRRREKRSGSRSWSPKRRRRSRSRSPPTFRRTSEYARRGRDQPPECVNFIRGRCFRGASCRFIHRDFGRYRAGDQEFHETLQKSRNTSRNDAPSPRKSHQDKVSAKEMDVEGHHNRVHEAKNPMKDEDLDKKAAAGSKINKMQLGDAYEAGKVAEKGFSELDTPRQEAQEDEEIQEALNTDRIKEEGIQSLPFQPPPADSLPDKLLLSEKSQGDGTSANLDCNVSGASHRPGFCTEENPVLQVPWNAMQPASNSNFQPVMRSYLPGQLAHPHGVDIHPQVSRPMDSSHQTPFHSDEFRQRPMPVGNWSDQPISREDRFAHPQILGDPRILPGSQRGHHLDRQSFSYVETKGSIPGQGYTGSSSFLQTNIMHPHLLSVPRDSLPNQPYSVTGFRPPQKSSSWEEQPYSHNPGLFTQQQPSSSSYPSNMGSVMVDSSRHAFSSSIPESKLPPHLSDMGVTKISAHYNPFASTFEQPLPSLQFASSAGAHGSKLTASPPNPRRTMDQFLPRGGGILHEAGDSSTHAYTRKTSADMPIQKQFVGEPTAGDAYDPLFDSIEPFSSIFRKLDASREQLVNDATTLSKSSIFHKSEDIKDNNGQKSAPATVLKSDADELGEVATDAEVGDVENASPQPENEKDWSPGVQLDVGNTTTGEIEIDQVQTPGRSKKSKDSRSMRLFKIVLADFVKEVLKPSWRQGNMSKEAFKTIVKKTVDKVSGAMSSHHIPKTQAKINQYVESSQRKLTKLVMGYVDKYVKM